MSLIRESEQEEILHYAFRYALGRQTYVVGFIADAVIHAWPEMTAEQRAMICREIRQAMAAGRAGSDIDVADWQRVLALEPARLCGDAWLETGDPVVAS